MRIHPFATLADRRQERAARHLLEQELASFTSEADRLELETIADRYSDEDSREIRQILFRLAA